MDTREWREYKTNYPTKKEIENRVSIVVMIISCILAVVLAVRLFRGAWVIIGFTVLAGAIEFPVLKLIALPLVARYCNKNNIE